LVVVVVAVRVAMGVDGRSGIKRGLGEVGHCEWVPMLGTAGTGVGREGAEGGWGREETVIMVLGGVG
jgi:hypothetical protein